MAFKEGDLVHITKQPSNQYVDLQDSVGLVEGDTQHPGCLFIHCIDEEGRLTGAGSVPVGDLEVCTDPVWIDAKAKHLAIQKANEDRVYQWNSDLLDAKIRVAEKMGISVDVVIEVLQHWDTEAPRNPYDR